MKFRRRKNLMEIYDRQKRVHHALKPDKLHSEKESVCSMLKIPFFSSQQPWLQLSRFYQCDKK
jgi:hypothetical protein